MIRELYQELKLKYQIWRTDTKIKGCKRYPRDLDTILIDYPIEYIALTSEALKRKEKFTKHKKLLEQQLFQLTTKQIPSEPAKAI